MFWKRRKQAHAAVVAPVEGVPESYRPDEVAKLSKTTTILVAPGVIAKVAAFAASYRHNEVGALLLGRIEGRFLHVEDAVRAERLGTATHVGFTPRDFERAQAAAKKDQIVVGWAHSHPSYGAFMSATDVRFQSQGQGLFPDYVGLVVDPFKPKGIEFCFFRLVDEKVVQLPHHYYTGGKPPEA